MDNIYIRTDPAGNTKADKVKSTEKIDDAIAHHHGARPGDPGWQQHAASVYNSRGILFLQSFVFICLYLCYNEFRKGGVHYGKYTHSVSCR